MRHKASIDGTFGGDEKSGWCRAGDVQAPTLDDARRWLVDWLQGRDLLGLELLPGGLMNRNCRLTIAESPDVVLRLYDRDASAAAKERAILELLADELPVSKVLYGPCDETSAPSFLLLDCSKESRWPTSNGPVTATQWQRVRTRSAACSPACRRTVSANPAH
jgi:hypothetical protein